MAVVKKKKSVGEVREEKTRYEKLEKLFPGGVAEVRAITVQKEPMIEGPVLANDRRKPMATCVPFRVHKELGTTNPTTGYPEVQIATVRLSIWPLPGRTDQFPEIRPFLKRPIEVLDYLFNKDHGYGKIYKLVPVPKELIEIEETAGMDPQSAALWKKMKNDFKTATSETVTVGESDEMVLIGEDDDGLTDDVFEGEEESESEAIRALAEAEA